MASPVPQQSQPQPEDPATLALEEGQGALADISLSPAAATAKTPNTSNNSKMGPFAFPFNAAAACAAATTTVITKPKPLAPKNSSTTTLPAAAAAASTPAAVPPAGAVVMPPASSVSMEEGEETKDERVIDVVGMGADVGVECSAEARQAAVRAALAIGTLTRAPEAMAATAGASVLLSLSCIAAEATGWFLAYNGLNLGSDVEASTGQGLNLLQLDIGWDRYSMSLNGPARLTTRFLDDVSPAAYALGILVFFLHLFTALATAALGAYLYHALAHGTLPKNTPIPLTRTPARHLAYTLLVASALLLLIPLLAFPALIIRDFHRAFAPHLEGGFTVRPSWAFGLSLLVCAASAALGGLLVRRAPQLDRIMAAAAAADK